MWAYEHALGALLMHLADPRIGWMSGGRAHAGDLAYLDQLTEFLAAGFLALPVDPGAARPPTPRKRRR